jgi:hypothetical protein
MVQPEIFGRSALALFAVFMLSASAHGQLREPSLEELETERLMDQASRIFEKHNLSIEELSADFHYRCLRAFGNTPFCECLVKKRPYVLRFEQYVGISSRTKAELDYDTLNNHSKEIVNEVFRLRDACVSR